MVISESKNGKVNMLIYQNSVLCLDRDDSLDFNIDNEYLKYKIRFTFSNEKEGGDFTTKKWETPEDSYVHFQLNNWDSKSFVEVINAFPLPILKTSERFLLKWRNHSVEGKNFRQFDITIWKEVADGK